MITDHQLSLGLETAKSMSLLNLLLPFFRLPYHHRFVLGTFIAFIIRLVFLIQHRHVKNINKAREQQRQKDSQAANGRFDSSRSHVITVASIDLKDDSIW